MGETLVKKKGGEKTMESIRQVLIRRDEMSEREADDLIAEAREALLRYLEDGDMTSADDICEEFFGLEPDYLMELI